LVSLSSAERFIDDSHPWPGWLRYSREPGKYGSMFGYLTFQVFGSGSWRARRFIF